MDDEDIEKIIDEAVCKGLLFIAGVNDEGEALYGLTEKGFEYVRSSRGVEVEQHNCQRN